MTNRTKVEPLDDRVAVLFIIKIWWLWYRRLYCGKDWK